MNKSLNHYFSENSGEPFEPREISVWLAGQEHKLFTASATFSPGHLDLGTSILLDSLPKAPTGAILDLGCGWGPIALDAALSNPETTVYAVDVNERALQLTQMNAERLNTSGVIALKPSEVPSELLFQQIRSNPPIRIGKEALHEMLSTWLPRLVPGGSAYLVVAKKLGAQSLQKWISSTWPNHTVELHERKKGFHVLHVQSPSLPEH